MTRQKFVTSVKCILMLLCILNSTYFVNCLRNGRSKRKAVEKNLLSNTQNRQSFSEFFGLREKFLNWLGVTYENPWVDYKELFVTNKTNNTAPIKGAHYGVWSEKDEECKILTKEHNLQVEFAECGKQFNEQKANNTGYKWAHWNPTNKCLMYKSDPNCLGETSDGYAFDSFNESNSTAYIFPPCFDGTLTWDIKANCSTNGNETRYYCMIKNWKSRDDECTKVPETIERPHTRQRQLEPEGGQTERRAEGEEGRKARERAEGARGANTTEGAERANTTEGASRTGRAGVPSTEKGDRQTRGTEGSTENVPGGGTGEQLIKNATDQAMEQLKEEEQKLEDKAKNEINKQVNQAEQEAAKHLLNQAKNLEGDLLSTLTGLVKNGTTSSGKRYGLALGAVDIAIMFVIATFVF